MRPVATRCGAPIVSVFWMLGERLGGHTVCMDTISTLTGKIRTIVDALGEGRWRDHSLVLWRDGYGFGDRRTAVDDALVGSRHLKVHMARRHANARMTTQITAACEGPQPHIPSVLERVARHHDTSGRVPADSAAAVEALDLIRPLVAVAWLASIAAGTHVVFEVWGTNHDPRRWRQPLRFDPPRFRAEPGTAYNLPQRVRAAAPFMSASRAPL